MFSNKKRAGINTFVYALSLYPYAAESPKASIKDYDSPLPHNTFRHCRFKQLPGILGSQASISRSSFPLTSGRKRELYSEGARSHDPSDLRQGSSSGFSGFDSGFVQHRKFAIHGLLVKSRKSDWLRI